MSINTAIILNGGKETLEEGASIPRSLIKINEKSVLERQIDSLVKAGIENIIISTFNESDHFDEFLESKSYKNINLYTTKDRDPLGSGGAVKNILLNSFIDSAIVLNGNSFIDIEIKDFLEIHKNNAFKNTMVFTKKGSANSKKRFDLKGTEVVKIIDQETEGTPTYINAGIYILDIEIFNITHLQKFSLEKEILGSIVAHDLGAYTSEQNLFSIKNQESFDLTRQSIDQ